MRRDREVSNDACVDRRPGWPVDQANRRAVVEAGRARAKGVDRVRGQRAHGGTHGRPVCRDAARHGQVSAWSENVLPLRDIRFALVPCAGIPGVAIPGHCPRLGDAERP